MAQMMTFPTMEKTERLAASVPELSALVSQHGHRKFWAGVKASGLEPDDFDSGSYKYRITVDPRVPADSAGRIKDHRARVWDDLRQDRLKVLNETLKTLNDDDVRHYEKCTVGVHAVTKDDLPPVDTLAGMDKFNEMNESTQRKVKAEQARKAKAMGMEFLMEKKKQDEARAKVAAFEKRMDKYKKDQQKQWEEKKKLSDQKASKRKGDAERAAEERREWEEETEAHLTQRMTQAKGRRAERYSPATIAAKLEANKQKRIDAFHMACEQEKQVLKRMSDKQEATERRLEEDRRQRDEYLEARRQAAADRYQQKQIQIYQQTADWVDDKLKEHKKHSDKVRDGAKTGKDNLKANTKNLLEFREKAHKLYRANRTRLDNEAEENSEALIERHHQADLRREALQAMALKNENDIFSYREVKHHTFGQLSKHRQSEIRKRTDCHLQALVFDVAERRHKDGAQTHAKKNLFDLRQQIAKDSLKFKNQAYEGFVKIARESDEKKVIGMMNALGFDMPKLPEEDDIDEGGGGGGPAY